MSVKYCKGREIEYGRPRIRLLYGSRVIRWCSFRWDHSRESILTARGLQITVVRVCEQQSRRFCARRRCCAPLALRSALKKTMGGCASKPPPPGVSLTREGVLDAPRAFAGPPPDEKRVAKERRRLESALASAGLRPARGAAGEEQQSPTSLTAPILIAMISY